MDSPITAAYLKVLACSAKVAQVIYKVPSIRIESQRDLWEWGMGRVGVKYEGIEMFCSLVITDTPKCIFFLNLTLKIYNVKVVGRIPYMGDWSTPEFLRMLSQYLRRREQL